MPSGNVRFSALPGSAVRLSVATVGWVSSSMVSVKPSESVSPSWSVTVYVNACAPTSPVPGVPETVRVEALNVSVPSSPASS